MHRKRHRCFCPVRPVLQQESQPGTHRKPVLPRFAKIKKFYSYYVYPYKYFIVLWRSMCVKRVRIVKGAGEFRDGEAAFRESVECNPTFLPTFDGKQGRKVRLLEKLPTFDPKVRRKERITVKSILAEFSLYPSHHFATTQNLQNHSKSVKLHHKRSGRTLHEERRIHQGYQPET